MIEKLLAEYIEMKNIKMIVTDLDHTLLRKDKTISEFTKKVLEKCSESGILVVFATARPERAARQLQIDPSLYYVIGNNGAIITHGEEEIKYIPIPETTKKNIIERFIADKNITGICAETGSLLYHNDSGYSTWETDFPKDTGWNLVYNDFLKPVTERICKLSVECAGPEIVFDILRNYPDLRIFPNTGELWSQITHESASKFNAILYLSKLSDIALQDIITFGDDFNDVEMLEKCGIGIAVENAVIEAKNAADFICGSNNNDGVAKYINEYLLAERGERV